MLPGVGEISDRHVEGIRDATPARFRGAGRARTGKLDDQSLAADRAHLVGGQAVLTSKEHERRDVPRRRRQDQPGRALAEQPDRRRVGDGHPHVRSEPAPDGALGEGHGEAAAAHVLGAGHETALDGLADEGLDGRLADEVEGRRIILGGDAGQRRIGRPIQTGRALTDEDDGVARAELFLDELLDPSVAAYRNELNDEAFSYWTKKKARTAS